MYRTILVWTCACPCTCDLIFKI